MLKQACSLFLMMTFSGCAVAYTFVNSEGKLERLSPSMSKDQVVNKIGTPDLVLRDDGRVSVWQYNMNTSRQWLYELALCPVSVFVGGCMFYPFTNWVATNHREHPVHLILINNQLCVWGPPLALLQKRKGCTGASMITEVVPNAQNREIYPATAGYGPISSQTIEQYRTLAVMTFADAPNAPGSGAKVSAIVTNLLLDLDMTIVERAKLEQVFDEQVVQLKHSEDANALRIGKIAGAKAIIVGEVQQWENTEPDKTAKVALTLRMIDVETGQLLFDGEGHSNDPISATPDNLARLIAHRIITRFGIKAGIIGTGRIGVMWDWREWPRSHVYLVQEISSGSPAEKAGLKVGDAVIACNHVSFALIETEREAKRACQIDAGQPLPLEVVRGDQRLDLQPIAERRPGI
ncbi:CsgG/HfaB family protein [Nitrospira sp. Nam74]